MTSPSYLSGKPQIAEVEALALLRQHFSAPIEDLTVLPGGEIAQIYAFAVNGAPYILRIAPPMDASLEKERFIQRLLAASPAASPSVLIAPIYHVGRLGPLHYAISRRMPGMPLSKLPPLDYLATIPALLDMLDAIHAVDVRTTTGYGVFADDGTGFLPTWRASLAIAGTAEPEPEADSDSARRSIFETTFLERAVWDTVHARMLTLLEFCPEDRYLVHGDYGFDHVLAAVGQITAVLDWVNAQYGDFLYDVAWLDFWQTGMSFRERCLTRYTERGIAVPHYAERILCYQCAIALNVLRFFALRQNADAYRFARDAIRSRLG